MRDFFTFCSAEIINTLSQWKFTSCKYRGSKTFEFCGWNGAEHIVLRVFPDYGMAHLIGFEYVNGDILDANWHIEVQNLSEVVTFLTTIEGK